jgi:prepilin-type N-terminal cleavage/methylation domain-containing protein
LSKIKENKGLCGDVLVEYVEQASTQFDAEIGQKDHFRKQPGTGNRGFTTIEIIAVLLLLAILTAVAVGRIVYGNQFNLRSEVETLKSHLRYAQIRAMSDIYPWRIRIETNSYMLERQLQDGTWIGSNLPGEDSETHAFKGGVSAAPQTVNFDEWGSPGSSDIEITIDSEAITITSKTGFVP